VFVLAGDWTHRRDVLSALGVAEEGLDRMEDVANPAPIYRAQGADRAAEIAAFVGGFDNPSVEGGAQSPGER